MSTTPLLLGLRRLHTQLSVARRALMLPHLNGEDAAIRRASFEITLGLKAIQQEDEERVSVDESAVGYLAKLRVLTRQSQLSPDDQAELSDVTDNLESLLDSMLNTCGRK